jgi:coenzyme F420-0:L-glutamate ligase / coenzyme F420-1:gamma-L-glutamate ligase
MPAPGQLQLMAVPGLPLIQNGDDLVALTLRHAASAGIVLAAHDVVVYAQKVVSKAEGRTVSLATVRASPRALELADVVQKDPRLVELVLSESRRVVRAAKDVLIVEHRLGFIMANAGIDQSNVNVPGAEEQALLLPVDPDASAARLRAGIRAQVGLDLGIVISDSFGRPWRVGTVGVAIGAAGIAAVRDLRGRPDLLGRKLQVTVVGHADEIAAAASLLMGQRRRCRSSSCADSGRSPRTCRPRRCCDRRARTCSDETARARAVRRCRRRQAVRWPRTRAGAGRAQYRREYGR